MAATQPKSGAPGNQAGERYTHGYHQAIMGYYRRRTAAECAAFLLPNLRPDAILLDVGCGQGTITAGLAHHASRVVGLDSSPEMVEAARARMARRGVTNTQFRVGSAYRLPWEDGYFDVVFAHQVLQHLADPIRALREARRVLRPGGLLAVRDADYGTMVHAPDEAAIRRWLDLYHQVTAANGGEADAGRYLLSWVTEAEFLDPTVTTSTTTHADPEERAIWGGMWAVRVIDSDFAQHAIRNGLAAQSELEEISAAFRRWSDRPDGFWAYLHAEVLAVRP